MKRIDSKLPLRYPGCRNRAGFTLIEVIVAMTLAVLITLLGAMVLKTGMDFMERARHYLHEQEVVRNLSRAVDSTWSLRAGGFFSADENAVQFSVLRLVRAPGLETARIVRFVCFPVKDDRYMLIEEYYDPPKTTKEGSADGGPQFLAEEILFDDLHECRFAYLDADEKEKVARWVDQWSPETDYLPRLLRLHIGLQRGALPPLVFVASE